MSEEPRVTVVGAGLPEVTFKDFTKVAWERTASQLYILKLYPVIGDPLLAGADQEYVKVGIKLANRFTGA